HQGGEGEKQNAKNATPHVEALSNPVRTRGPDPPGAPQTRHHTLSEKLGESRDTHDRGADGPSCADETQCCALDFTWSRHYHRRRLDGRTSTLQIVTEASALTGPPIASTSELLERQAAIQAALPTTDGLAWFNRMYQLVTDSVATHLAATTFADPAWLARLDVVFGNMYLDAGRGSVQAPEQVPRAWAALLEQRAQSGIAPLQFALAGMNAHINRDLPVAVVTTCQQLGTAPDADSHHADFFQVNAVLAQA